MRIIHFISSPAAGGIESYVRDMSIAMRNRGHEVCIVFMEDAHRKARDLEYRKSFLDDLDRNAVAYRFLGYSKRKPFLFARLKASKIVKEFDADLVHCHLYSALLLFLFIGSVPVFYTHHSIKLKVPSIFYRIFDFRVSGYVGICLACADMISRIARGRVFRIDNGVDSTRFPYVYSAPDRGEITTALMVGSLRPEKNYPLVIEALSHLQEIPLILLVAGEGAMRDELVRLAHEFDVADKVRFLGNVSNISSLMSEVSFFAMSSSQEGLPISLIEATVSGLPVVVTNVGGCAEVVHRCLNGIVVDDLSAREYAAALKKMVTDARLHEGFVLNAKKYSSQYSLDESVQKHLEMYESIF